jgi:hypothetical protein
MRARHGSSLVTNRDDPGPGQYNPNIKAARPDSIGAKIGTSRRSDVGGGGKGTKDWPGPGQFNIKDQLAIKGNGYSFGTG